MATSCEELSLPKGTQPLDTLILVQWEPRLILPVKWWVLSVAHFIVFSTKKVAIFLFLCFHIRVPSVVRFYLSIFIFKNLFSYILRNILNFYFHISNFIYFPLSQLHLVATFYISSYNLITFPLPCFFSIIFSSVFWIF